MRRRFCRRHLRQPSFQPVALYTIGNTPSSEHAFNDMSSDNEEDDDTETMELRTSNISLGSTNPVPFVPSGFDQHTDSTIPVNVDKDQVEVMGMASSLLGVSDMDTELTEVSVSPVPSADELRVSVVKL